MKSASDLSREGVEVWASVPGFDGFYEVSNLGRVMSLARWAGRNGKQWRTVRILKAQKDKYGYLKVLLFQEGHLISWTVHKLVLLAFGFERPAGCQCRHLDGVHANNRLYNLMWGTAKQNGEDKVIHGVTARGERNGGGGKLTDDQVRKIFVALGPHRSIAREYCVSQVLVSAIKRQKTWAHVTQSIDV